MLLKTLQTLDKAPPPKFPVGVALGALIIKEKLQLSDQEAVNQIEENPYPQYFLGFPEYQEKAPFDSSMYVHFRKRLGDDVLSEYNEIIVAKAIEGQNKEDNNDSDDNEPPTHKGKLLIDATCAPSDIAFPTDLGSLNDARERAESIIDTLHAPLRGKADKPRAYRVNARKAYLSVAKLKSPGRKRIRKGIRQQLNFLRRDLKYIDDLVLKIPLSELSTKQYHDLLVINELYRQQYHMFTKRTHSIKDRIISISQPYLRPIARGKAKAKVELGAKVSASVVDGFIYAYRISFDAYNEGEDLPFQVEAYKRCYGYYPESIHAD